MTTTRVGLGFDVHGFSDRPGRPLVLGGITIEGEQGLDGHSDADAVTHAVADALLGAAGLGDLGSHFPDTDPAWQDADSCRLLAVVAELVTDAGWSIGNVDCSLVAEAPRLAPYRDAMQERLSDILGAPVTVKPKRAETLGALGRREGIACLAIALIERES